MILNFSSSGCEQLPKRFIELLNHCGGEHLVSAVRRRIIERVVFTEYQLGCLDLYLVELGRRIDEAVRPNRSGPDHAADSDTRRVHGGYDESNGLTDD